MELNIKWRVGISQTDKVERKPFRQKPVHANEYKHEKQPQVFWCSLKMKGVER